jgi:peptidase M48-like protein
MTRRHRTASAPSTLTMGLLLLVLGGCAAVPSPSGRPPVAPNGRPLDEDEAGLWMEMDRAEHALTTSGRLLDDPAVTAYLRHVVCRVAGPLCPDIRVYVVRQPEANAIMAPNGAMQVWTGLLLRVENEAQLAYVLAHEVGHYREKHALQQWRDLRAKTGGLAVLQALTGPVSLGIVGGLGALVVLGSVQEFSREQEREADVVAVELLEKAGYDGREAVRVWEVLAAEQQATTGKRPGPFASHPSPEDRIRGLRTAAHAPAGPPLYVGEETYRSVVRPLWSLLLRDELRRRQLPASEIVLDRLLARAGGSGELHFYRGELYRLRAAPGDPERALASYERAVGLADAPVEAYRALGLLAMKKRDPARARAAFARYLEENPHADDREMVEAYLRRLE